MGKLFGEDSGLMKFLSKVTDLMLMNILWLVGCIPIITIGASTVALHYCIEKYRSNDAIKIFPVFWRAYRSNFKQATLLLGVQFLLLLIIIADIWVLYSFEIAINIILLILMGSIALLCLLAMSFIFPLQAQFVNSIGQTVKNSFLISFLSFPKAIQIGILTYLPVGLFLLAPIFFYKSLIIWLLLGISGIAYINSFIFHHIFKRFCAQDVPLEE